MNTTSERIFMTNHQKISLSGAIEPAINNLDGLDDFGSDDFAEQLDDFMEGDFDEDRPDDGDSELDSFFSSLSIIDDLEVRQEGSVSERKAQTLEEVEDWLLNRTLKPEKPYGMFTKDATILKFFDDKHNENILSDIRQKNKKQKMGNIKIPGSNIELINYSYCPQCQTIYSFQEVVDYYRNPSKTPHVDRKLQYRQDTRMHCRHCDTFFLPAVVICDGSPKNEVQCLCRMQTIEAIETFYQQKRTQILTKKSSNILKNDKGRTAVLNDIRISDLQSQPNLITNLLQYTPAPLMISFVEEQNVENQEVIYGAWFQSGQWRQT